MADDERSLTIVVHGESGVGKSWFGDTAPAPRLILDVEGGSKFTPSKKTKWDGLSDPPAHDGSWDTCVVKVRDAHQVQTIFQWLNSGKHPFESVVIDSLTEVQKRYVDSISGTNAMQTQDWGQLLRQMEGLVRQFRDLTTHPIKPLQAVIFICPTRNQDGRFRPHLQGQIGINLPYFVDVVGYLFVQQTDDGNTLRRMLVQPQGEFDAKDRTNRLGVVLDNPNVVTMLDVVYGEES